MPNWCSNTLTLTHEDPAMIVRAHAALEEGRFLQEFCPVPQALRDTVAGFVGEDERAAHEAQMARNIELHGYKDWYDWCVANWGTKWDCGEKDRSDISLGGETLETSFETAWSPPLAAYEALVSQGFGVTAMYYESSMGFVGRWDNGDDLCYDYSGLNSETVRGYIGDELDDYWGISESMADQEEEEAETCKGSYGC